MISRAHRFHGFNSLRFVYRNGQAVRGPLFGMKYVLNPRRDSYRAAVVISRKVHKSAFVRNRIRRRLYEALRQFEPQIKQPFDIALTVFSDTLADEPAASLTSELQKQLQAAKIIDQRT